MALLKKLWLDLGTGERSDLQLNIVKHLISCKKLFASPLKKLWLVSWFFLCFFFASSNWHWNRLFAHSFRVRVVIVWGSLISISFLFCLKMILLQIKKIVSFLKFCCFSGVLAQLSSFSRNKFENSIKCLSSWSSPHRWLQLIQFFSWPQQTSLVVFLW